MILSLVSFSQSSDLRIIDFYVLPEPLINDYPENNDTSITRLNILFKCSDFSEADSVFLFFGTTEGSSDIMIVPINVSGSGSPYTLTCDGNQFTLISAWDARIYFTIEKEIYRGINYATIYTKDNSGETSPSVSYHITY